MNRVGNLHFAPSWETLSWEDKEAFDARGLAVEEFADMSEADQAFIRKGELEVSAGLSRSLVGSGGPG